MNYTVELYKLDRRQKDGRVLVSKTDFEDIDLGDLETLVPVGSRYIREIHETYVTRKNAMTGETFQERYDTPYFCSPSSESYWSA
jgi:hypothetical protein